MTSPGIADFLLARIAEDEMMARSATPGPWCSATHAGDTEIVVAEGYGFPAECGGDAPNADHIARHDPARVLAECDAKRRIVESRRSIDGPGHMLAALHKQVQYQREYVWRLLALPYADHPDYRPEWKP